MTANNIRSGVSSLQVANVRPLIDESMGGLIHPSVARDVYNDTSFNGLTDILKRGDSSDRAKLFDMPKNDAIVEFAGVKFKSTTTVPQVTIGGNTYYQSLIVGDDAQFSIFLGPNGDGDKNYKLNIQVAPENGSVSDPVRTIGGWVSYNTKFTNTLPPGTTQRLRIIQSETSSS
jgi:hypothetical protein